MFSISIKISKVQTRTNQGLGMYKLWLTLPTGSTGTIHIVKGETRVKSHFHIQLLLHL